MVPFRTAVNQADSLKFLVRSLTGCVSPHFESTSLLTRWFIANVAAAVSSVRLPEPVNRVFLLDAGGLDFATGRSVRELLPAPGGMTFNWLAGDEGYGGKPG